MSVLENASPIAVTVADLLAMRTFAVAAKNRNKRPVMSRHIGQSRSRVLGRGLDFSELREYQAGDDIRQIDWNVTARTGRPHTKLFSEEREKPYFVVLDLSDSMHFATRVAYKSVIAARFAAILAWSAVMAGDRVGGLIFNAQKHIEIKPESGRRGLTKIFRAIAEMPFQQTDAVADHSFSDSLSRLSHLAHTGSTIWFLSDFARFEQTAKNRFNHIMRHNEVNAIHVYDPLEANLPPAGSYRVRDRLKQLQLDTRPEKIRSAYRQQFDQRCEFLDTTFNGARHYYLPLATDADFSDKLDSLFNRRRLLEVT